MRAILALLLGGSTLVAACDQLPDFRAGGDDDPHLSLSLDVSDVLDWGGVSSIRLTLTNDGDATSSDTHVELYLPTWLEFSSVEPAGTEVSLVSADPETRLRYHLGDPALRAGESRTIVQRVRVPPRPEPVIEAEGEAPPATAPGPADTADAAEPAVPENRTLRARLVSPDGAQLGAEVRTVMPFRGAPREPMAPPGGPGDTAETRPTVEGDRVGPVRLGATVADLRAAVPAARDTTFTLGEGLQERGLAVPIDDGGRALALIVDDRVERIIVRDPGLRTQGGHGVGSTFQELRQVYGSACSAPAAGGGTAVWFPNLPGISFGFDTPASAARDTTAAGAGAAPPPDGARVRELWVRRGEDRC